MSDTTPLPGQEWILTPEMGPRVTCRVVHVSDCSVTILEEVEDPLLPATLRFHGVMARSLRIEEFVSAWEPRRGR